MSSLRWITVDDTDPSIQYVGSGWFQDQGSQNNKGNFGQSYQSTLHGTQLSASFSFAFSGISVKILGLNNLLNDSGVYDPRWECFVDNISIAQFPPSMVEVNYYPLCQVDQLSDGPHIVTVNVTVAKEQTFWFDQIQYFPSSSTSLDNATIAIDNEDPSIKFGDGWEGVGNFFNATNTPNANVTFSFTGVSVSWYSYIPLPPRAPTTGSYSVDGSPPVNFFLNGIQATNSSLDEYNQKIFETPQYKPGPHQLVVTYLGDSSTTPLTLDYLIVQNGTSTSSIAPSGTSMSTGKPSSHNGSSGNSNHSKHTGSTVGGVVGGLVVIALAIAVFLYFRRWSRKKKQRDLEEKEDQFEIDGGMVIKPFHLAPSVKPATSTGVYTNYPPDSSVEAFTSNSSQVIAESQSLIPLSNVRTPAPASFAISIQQRQPPSGKSRLQEDFSEPLCPNDGVPQARQQTVMVSEKERQEAEATVAVIRPQQLLHHEVVVPPQTQNLSPGFGPARMMVHEDSGLRLLANEGGVVEVPPLYTAG